MKKPARGGLGVYTNGAIKAGYYTGLRYRCRWRDHYECGE